MTTYVNTAPGPAVAEIWDVDGDRWERTPIDPVRWRQRSSEGSAPPLAGAGRTWREMVDYAPFDDRLNASVGAPVITPEIRAAALSLAVVVGSTITSRLTNDDQLVTFGKLNPKNLYEMADSYAHYIATGEHPT